MIRITCLGSLLLLIWGLSSCGESKSYKSLRNQYDSIALLNQEYEQDMHQTDSLVSTVLSTFQEIKNVGGTININPRKGDLRKREKERIAENVQMLRQRLEASSIAIDQMISHMSSGRRENKLLRSTLELLRSEMEIQKELLAQDEAMMQLLDKSLSKLNGQIKELNTKISDQDNQLAHQDLELGKARYCIGTKTDLMEMNIINKKGVINPNMGDANYFETSDMRQLVILPLMSGKAQLLSVHPERSYEFIRDEQKNLSLVIKDYQLFWRDTRTLVIQVE